MKAVRWVIVFVLLWAAGLCWIVPFAYWLKHPEESQMQIFLSHWKHYLVGVAMGLAGVFIAPKEGK